MLPKGWVEADIGELCNLVNGKAFKPSDWSKTGLPIIRIQNLNNSQAFYNYYDREIPDKFLVNKGDLLFAWSGTPGTSFGAHLWMGQKAILNQHIFKIIFNELSIDKNYFKIAINSTLYELIGKAHGGVGLAHVTKGNFETTKLPLPPLAEQCRIVAKLDSLTTRIARARAELERVQVLKVHLRRQALNSCFADLGKHELSLGELLQGIEAGKNMRCVERPPVAGEKGVVKVSAVTWGRFDATQTKTLPNDYLPPIKARIMKDDLLISRANTLELVGAAVIVDVQPDNIFLSDKILRLIVDENKKSWVLWYLRSPEGRSQIESLATGNQLSMRNISQAALRQIKIPLPEAAIRQQRLTRLTATIKTEMSLETEAQRALTLLDRLESSLLAKAFRGELVPQDPNDEPASVLLNRIRAERAADTKPKRGRKQSTQDMSLPRKRQTKKHG